MKALYLLDKFIPLMVGIPADRIQVGISIHQRNRDLCSKLNIAPVLSSYDGTHMGLGDADNPPGNTMHLPVIHLLLLSVQLTDDQQIPIEASLQDGQGNTPAQLFNTLEVPPHILQLLPDCPSGILALLSPLLHNLKVIFPGFCR